MALRGRLRAKRSPIVEAGRSCARSKGEPRQSARANPRRSRDERRGPGRASGRHECAHNQARADAIGAYLLPDCHLEASCAATRIQHRLIAIEMPRQVIRTEDFDVSPAEVMRVLTSEDLLYEQQRLQGATDVCVSTLRRSESTLVLRVESVERIRNLASFIPGSGAPSSVTYTWALPSGQCEWHYQSPHGSRLVLTGGLHILPRDGGSRLTSTFAIHVTVPVIAAAAEHVVAGFITANYPEFIAAVRDRISTAAEN